MFSYDALDRNVKIVETESGSVTSTKEFVLPDSLKSEERNAVGSVQKRFYFQGQSNGGTSYFYALDHLGSVHEMLDNNGASLAQYSYDPYGRVYGSESEGSDYKFAGLYSHARSELSFGTFRAYISSLGRWLNRDPLPNSTNMYSYVSNHPTVTIDRLGLFETNPGYQNCIGHGLESPVGVSPSHGESLKQMFGKFGYKCHPVASAAECKCAPKEKKLIFNVYKFKGDTNPFSDPWPYVSGPNGTMHPDPDSDIHVFKQYQSATKDKPAQWSCFWDTKPNFVPATTGWTTLDVDYWNSKNKKNSKGIYCCCKSCKDKK